MMDGQFDLAVETATYKPFGPNAETKTAGLKARRYTIRFKFKSQTVKSVVPPLPPYNSHQYQNKGVRSCNRVKSIKTKDLSRMK